MNIGKRVKDLRKNREWNQTEFSEKIGVSLNTLSKFEKGICDLPSESLKRAAELFNVSADYLLTGREEPNTIKEDEAEVLELYRHDDQLKELLKKAVEAKKKIIEFILQELPMAA